MNSFALLLLIATLVTGVCYVYDFVKKRPGRKAAYAKSLTDNPSISKKDRRALLEPSGIIGQTGSLFWIILIVFVFRSFIIEPFRIPSSSMMPTLQAGDFIAVSKWSCGFRNPLTNATWIETGKPQRGDVIVFKYPEDPSTDFIKRVIGTPGDIVVYKDKKLFIIPSEEIEEGQHSFSVDKLKEIARTKVGTNEENSFVSTETFDVYEDELMGFKRLLQINPSASELPAYYKRQGDTDLGGWMVEKDSYFVMGDNRDNSRDSRFWGFVPQEYVIGKTIGIWFSVNFDRDEKGTLPTWIPSSVNFDRIGGIR